MNNPIKYTDPDGRDAKIEIIPEPDAISGGILDLQLPKPDAISGGILDSQPPAVSQGALIDMVSRSESYRKYPAKWILDVFGLQTPHNVPGRNNVLGATLFSLKQGKNSNIEVYINPSVLMGNEAKRILIFGHEERHVRHIRDGDYTRWLIEYGVRGAWAISEYWARKWHVETGQMLGKERGFTFTSLQGEQFLAAAIALLPPGYFSNSPKMHPTFMDRMFNIFEQSLKQKQNKPNSNK
jgi:hypothetical protein